MTTKLLGLLFISVAASLADQPVHIVDVIENQHGGTRFNGILRVVHKTAGATASPDASDETQLFSIKNGALDIWLKPSSSMSLEADYLVSYIQLQQISQLEEWRVPSLVGTVSLAIVKVKQLSPKDLSVFNMANLVLASTATIPEANVIGLVTDLAVRPAMGPGYSVNRVLFSDYSGYLETVVGSSSDCVVADGTTVPCGSSITLAGDVVGAPDSVTVTRIQNHAVSNALPLDQQLMAFSSASQTWAPQTPPPLNGDVGGSPTSTIVRALQGFPVSAVPPGDNQTLVYHKSAQAWSPTSMLLSGDVAGAPGPVTVTGIQNHAVSNALPLDQQLMAFSGASQTWAPQTPSPLNGDVRGSPTLTIVTALQGFPVSAVPPGDNQSLVYHKSLNLWSPTPVASAGPLVSSQLGDLALTYSNSTTLLLGAACSATMPCPVRIGAGVFRVTAPATITLVSGSGRAYVYLDNNGQLTAGSGLTLSCSGGCIALTGVSSFPLNSIPLATWDASANAWLNGGGVDQRAFLSENVVVGGAGMLTISTQLETTFSVDTSVIPYSLSVAGTLSFPSIQPASCAPDQTLSLPGVLTGEPVMAGWPGTLPGGIVGSMFIRAPDVVTVRICNFLGSTITLAASQFEAGVVHGSLGGPPAPTKNSVAAPSSGGGTLIPIRFRLAPSANTAFALVEFGFHSNTSCPIGATMCASATEQIDLSAGLAGFKEGAIPSPCAAGCTVTVPGMTHEVLFYRVKRLYADGKLQGVGALSSLVVP